MRIEGLPAHQRLLVSADLQHRLRRDWPRHEIHRDNVFLRPSKETQKYETEEWRVLKTTRPFHSRVGGGPWRLQYAFVRSQLNAGPCRVKTAQGEEGFSDASHSHRERERERETFLPMPHVSLACLAMLAQEPALGRAIVHAEASDAGGMDLGEEAQTRCSLELCGRCTLNLGSHPLCWHGNLHRVVKNHGMCHHAPWTSDLQHAVSFNELPESRTITGLIKGA